jgi:predicted glycogen debranching enzyme
MIPDVTLDFGRAICSHLPAAEKREWLVTNSIGGYACGTLSGILTRCYHGLLIAALDPPLGRTLLVVKLDETATYTGRTYPLFANRRVDGETWVEPEGFHHLERFHLEDTTPVWTYACADARLEKRVWMEAGANTTYVMYRLQRGSAPMRLRIELLANHRDHHTRTEAGALDLHVGQEEHGLCVTGGPDILPFYVLSEDARATPHHDWREGYFLQQEAYRGLDPEDAHLYAGQFDLKLEPGQSVTLVCSTDPAPELDGAAAYARRHAYEYGLLARAPLGDAPAAIRQLVLAADQFIVRRTLPGDPDGRSIIAGYPWFGDWGRDTMISLPGLTLTTGRHGIAARILRIYAHFVDRGMLPNRFPDVGDEPEYNTVDATLWYFEAIRAYHAATGDDGLLRDLFPVLVEIVDWHRRGTRYAIHLDTEDGLLYAGEEGVQLTWMDAKMEDWVVTPRIGKPVEINALWYNALRSMAGFARRLGQDPVIYRELAEQAREGFRRFWNDAAGYCYDVIDGPSGFDASLRPNQLLAVSLPASPLDQHRQKSVVDACARYLLTSHGMRSLSPHDRAYTGHYGGDRKQRDAAYHQGTVWGWLIGPFVSAHLRVYNDVAQARAFLLPLLQHLAGHGVGSLSEIFDGEPPFTPRGCIAQAWSVAEVLRTWQTTLK